MQAEKFKEVPYCKDCIHFMGRSYDYKTETYLCMRNRTITHFDPVLGNHTMEGAVSCLAARSESGFCGAEGKEFVRKPPSCKNK